MEWIAKLVSLLLLLIACVPVMLGQRRDASLSEQKLCSEQADKIKADQQSRFPHDSFSVTSHYSKQQNICWVQTRLTSIRDGVLVSDISDIMDGFEQVTYGTCAINDHPNHEIVACWAADPKTTDREEFQSTPSWRAFVEAKYFSQ